MLGRISLVVTLAGAIAMTVTPFVTSSQASALSGSSFDAGNIIDDAIFYDSGSMSSNEIQSFLNSKVPTCDTNGTTQKSYYYNSSTGRVNNSADTWVTTSRATYGARYDTWYNTTIAAAPYTCLKDYKQNTPIVNAESGICGYLPARTGRTAALIISDVSSACGVSPKVLIVLLQKEQGLVTDVWPWDNEYQKATGFGCPDTSGCDATYYGFFNQVYSAARQFKRYRADPTNWNYVAGQNNKIYYNPKTTCGYSWVYIKNQATAGLYDYTPYQPNKAALNNLYGTGDSCSAYGNRNFWRYFNDWFGSTKYPQPIGAFLYRQSSTGRIYLTPTNDDGTQTRFYIPDYSTMKNYKIDSYSTIPADDATIQAIPDGGTLTNTIRDTSGNVYLVNNGSKYHLSGSSICTAWGFDCFDSTKVHTFSGLFMSTYLTTNGTVPPLASYGGVYYKLDNGSRLPFANNKSLADSGYTTSSALAVNAVNAFQPLGNLIVTTPGIIKFSPKSALYYYDGTQYWSVGSMDVYNAWGLSKVAGINEPLSSYNGQDDPVVAGSLSFWHSDTTGSKFVVNNGAKLKLSTVQENLWPTSTFSAVPASLFNTLPTGTLQEFIKTGHNYFKLVPDVGEKRYISGMSNYYDLGVSASNTTNLIAPLTDSIKSGPFAFANGRLIKVQGDATIYVMNNDKIQHVASMSVLYAYNFNTSQMSVYPLASINEYQKAGELRNALLPDGSVVLPFDRHLIKLTAAQISSYGLQTSGFSSITVDMTKRASITTATAFWRNSSNGSLYYANGGALHYISSMQKFYNLGGRSTPLTNADVSILNLFTVGDPV